MNKTTLFDQRNSLQFKAVIIQCLDKNDACLKTASGFIRRENSKLYLYTCWHVVTDYNPNELKVRTPPNSAFL